MPLTNAPAALWYLAPGLVHLLGNALFTVHGRVRLLTVGDPAQLADDCRAIADGVDRAHEALALLRWLVEDSRQTPVALDVVLRAVCDVARVPLRDHGLALELEAVPAMAALPVDPGPTCRLVVAVLRLLGTEHSGGAAGQVRLTATAVGSEVLLRFAATAGHGAPLPRDPMTAGEALRSELLASAARQQPGPDLWFAFPALQPTLRAP